MTSYRAHAEKRHERLHARGMPPQNQAPVTVTDETRRKLQRDAWRANSVRDTGMTDKTREEPATVWRRRGLQIIQD